MSSRDPSPSPSDATPPQMPEMVERVAQVIMGACECTTCDRLVFDGFAHHDCGCEHPSWDEASPENKARAVLAIMREPTPEMLSAADGAEIAGYIAMIDAAIGGLVASPNADDRSRDEKENARQAEA